MRIPCLALIGLCLLQAGCSTEQLYATGRNAQRAQCVKQADTTAQNRCLEDAGMPHDVYNKETEAARAAATKP